MSLLATFYFRAEWAWFLSDREMDTVTVTRIRAQEESCKRFWEELTELNSSLYFFVYGESSMKCSFKYAI
jgi:hypothetical protein